MPKKHHHHQRQQQQHKHHHHKGHKTDDQAGIGDTNDNVAQAVSVPASSTLNPIYEYSEEMNAAAEHDFNERRLTLQEGCARWKLVDKYPVNSWEFFISPGHGLAWCNIFKAASSAWMYYFNILGEWVV